MKVVFAFLVGIFFTNSLCAKPMMIWLRPVSYGVYVQGTEIVDGPELRLMRFLSSYMGEFEHQYQSFPVKRNWLLIREQSTPEKTYCFYGASKTKERMNWGYFSEPTTILLPYPIVSLQGTLDSYTEDGYVSLRDLLESDLKTVVFDGVENKWTQALSAITPSAGNVLKMNTGNQDAAITSAKLLSLGRIDFAFIGSGYEEIRNVEESLGIELDVHKVHEFRNNTVVGNRIFCSKTEQGKVIVEKINTNLQAIMKDRERNHLFRDLNFSVIGYHPSMNQSFNDNWHLLHDQKVSLGK